MKKKYADNAKIFRAFCDEHRLMILEMLQNGEKCACKILDELDIAQSTLSHHMKILVDSGVVIARKDGKWTYYSLSTQGCNKANDILKDVTHIKSETECNCSCK